MTIENVRRFKRLVYLNLALNCIERIENLDGCESLQKLDLTANFVRRPSDLGRLAANVDLRELFVSPTIRSSRRNSTTNRLVAQVPDGEPVRAMSRLPQLRHRRLTAAGGT